jgi:uncharacterized membrane protein (UPF0127 family)
MHRFVFSFILFMLLTLPVFAAELQDITVVTPSAKHVLHVEVAVTPQDHMQGLMYRTEMPEDQGMLFLFPQSAPRGFWMRNTLIPLDMIFIKEDGVIANIHPNARPKDETVIYSDGPVSRVLELNGGTAERLGLKAGDKFYNEAYFGNKLAP